jgi:hypothetical protein
MNWLSLCNPMTQPSGKGYLYVQSPRQRALHILKFLFLGSLDSLKRTCLLFLHPPDLIFTDFHGEMPVLKKCQQHADTFPP